MLGKLLFVSRRNETKRKERSTDMMWATYCSMQHSHDNIFAGCLTFRDFCQIFNATHLFSHPAAARLPYSRNLLSCAILPSCRPVVLASFLPHSHICAARTPLRVCVSKQHATLY